MITRRTLAEIAGVLGAVYILDRVYHVTGAVWFAHLNFWVAPLPLIVVLIPFLVLVIGPASKRVYDFITSHIEANSVLRDVGLQRLAEDLREAHEEDRADGVRAVAEATGLATGVNYLQGTCSGRCKDFVTHAELAQAFTERGE